VVTVRASAFASGNFVMSAGTTSSVLFRSANISATSRSSLSSSSSSSSSESLRGLLLGFSPPEYSRALANLSRCSARAVHSSLNISTPTSGLNPIFSKTAATCLADHKKQKSLVSKLTSTKYIKK
jgi:hypothetical protein